MDVNCLLSLLAWALADSCKLNDNTQHHLVYVVYVFVYSVLNTS